LNSTLRLGDGGVRSGAGSFDLALNSVNGTKSAAARKNTYLSPLSGSSSVRPSIKQATKTVAALLFALRRVPGGRRHVPQRGRALLCAYYRALVAILLFGAPEDGGDCGALGRRTAGDGASCRSTQAGEMRDREESRDERPEIFFILQYNP
jgi:hypothetical protein